MGKKSGGRVRVKQVGPKAPVNPLADLTIPPEEMIHLPPKPDSNITHVWPPAETFTMDYKMFSAIYPTYLDSTKSIKHGRRIGAKDAIEDPSVFEIGMALQVLNIRHAIQPYKGYSRDAESRWDNLGRVLFDTGAAATAAGDVVTMGTDGSFDLYAMPNVAGGGGDGGVSKKALCRRIAKIIPDLPARAKRMEEKKQAEEEEKKARERALTTAKSGGAKGGGGGGGTSSKKKKGKKKR